MKIAIIGDGGWGTANALLLAGYGHKKLEPFWNMLIKAGLLNKMLPALEFLLSHTK